MVMEQFANKIFLLNFSYQRKKHPSLFHLAYKQGGRGGVRTYGGICNVSKCWQSEGFITPMGDV